MSEKQKAIHLLQGQKALLGAIRKRVGSIEERIEEMNLEATSCDEMDGSLPLDEMLWDAQRDVGSAISRIEDCITHIILYGNNQ